MLTLSDNKKTFLKTGLYSQKPYQLQAIDIDTLVDHYAKQGITLIKNGQRSLSLLSRKKNDIRQKIKNLSDNSKKYAIYLQINLFPPGEMLDNGLSVSNLLGSPFSEYYNTIIHSIKKFISEEGILKKDLSDRAIAELNEICSRFPFQSRFDEFIKKNIKKLEDGFNDICLDAEEAIVEIKAIRQELKPGEKVGYIFTNSSNQIARHMEVLIITCQAIIKPITWLINPYFAILPVDFKGEVPMYITDLGFFIPSSAGYSSIKLPYPQSDRISCGILGVSYLKKLLKNNASELNELSLAFSFYNARGRKQHFFLPSPIVFSYSQSSKYILFLEKIMANEAREIFEQQEIYTLEGLLRISIQKAEEKNDREMKEHNAKILESLSTLRPSWLKASEAAREKREQMKEPNTELNRYLAYTAHRFDRRVSEAKQSPVSYFFNSSRSVSIVSENSENEMEASLLSTYDLNPPKPA